MKERDRFEDLTADRGSLLQRILMKREDVERNNQIRDVTSDGLLYKL